MSGSLEEARDSIATLRNSTREVLNSLKSELNLTQLLEQVESFWDGVQSHADQLLKQLNETVAAVETQLSKYVHYIRMGFFIVGGVFMVMLTAATLIATLLVYRAIHDRLFAYPNTESTGSFLSLWLEAVYSLRLLHNPLIVLGCRLEKEEVECRSVR